MVSVQTVFREVCTLIKSLGGQVHTLSDYRPLKEIYTPAIHPKLQIFSNCVKCRTQVGVNCISDVHITELKTETFPKTMFIFKTNNWKMK